MKTRFSLACLAVLSCMLAVAARAANDSESEPAAQKVLALPATELFTLTLVEDGTTHEYSMTVAARHFSLNLGDKEVSFRGRIWQHPADAHRLLEFTIEYHRWVDAEPGRRRVASAWSGSTELAGKGPIDIVRFPRGAFSVRLEPVE
jgi:hypothetical protein